MQLTAWTEVPWAAKNLQQSPLAPPGPRQSEATGLLDSTSLVSASTQLYYFISRL